MIWMIRSSNFAQLLIIDQVSRTSSIIDIIGPSKMADVGHIVNQICMFRWYAINIKRSICIVYITFDAGVTHQNVHPQSSQWLDKHPNGVHDRTLYPQIFECNYSKCTGLIALLFDTRVQYQKLHPHFCQWLDNTQKMFVITLCIPQYLICNKYLSDCSKNFARRLSQYEKTYVWCLGHIQSTHIN